MAKDVVVKITQQQVAGSIGLGIPLIIEGGAAKAVAYTECRKLDEVVAAGFAEDTKVYKKCAAIFAQDKRPAKVAVCASTDKISAELGKLKDKEVRQIVPVLGEADTYEDLAAFVDTTEDRMLFVSVASADELPKEKSDRVCAIVYGGTSEDVEAALVGATAGYAAGQITYKNIVLRGVEPEDLTDEKIMAIHEAGAICILKKAGDVVTSEGKVMSGEYADIIDSIDFVITNITYKVQKLFNINPKVAFTNAGIGLIENSVYSVLASAYQQGIIADGDNGVGDFSTTFLKREETTEEERKTRTYNGGSFQFALAGAVHYANINGTLII